MSPRAKAPRLLKPIAALIAIFVASAFFVCQPRLARAQDAAKIKTVRVGWLLNNTGFQEGAPDEHLSGWGYDYLQTLSYYTPGWKYEYVTGSFTELMDKLEAGEIDLMPNISYTEERAQKLLFSTNPQGTEHYYIYAKPSRDDLTRGDPQALNGLTIGANRGVMQTTVALEWLEDEGIDCNVVYYDTANDLFDALADDKIDAMVMNDTLSSPDAMAMFSVGESNYYLTVPRSRPDLMDDINAAMTTIRSINPRYNDEVKSAYSIEGSGSSSLTGRERAWLDGHDGKIVFGYLNGKLPFCNEGPDGELEGSLKKLTESLAAQFDIKVETRPFESNAAMASALAKGTIDVAMPVAKDYWLAEQDGSIQSAALATVSLTAIYSGDDLDKALGNIVYSESSIVNGNELRLRYPASTVTQYTSTAEALWAAETKEPACIITPTTSLDTIRDQHDLDSFKIAELGSTVDLSCWMQSGDAELLAIVNKGIANAGGSILASSYNSDTYAARESSLFKFLYRNRAAIIVITIAALVAIVIVLVRLLRRARAAQREAQAANSAKTAFLARMSHDIRTPLNGIVGLIEVDELHPDDVELIRRNREKAKVAADHLLTLINDILEMSKIEDRAVILEEKPFNLNELCGEVYTISEMRAAEKGIELITDNGVNLPYVDLIGSPVHIRQILINVTDNCIKYNKPGGSVTCTSDVVDIDGDRVTYKFVTKDTGIGMSQEFLKRIFEPFSQEHDDARSTFQGTGMGMSIVHALVEQMDGTIDITSKPGVSSTFVICLPFQIDRHPRRTASLPEPKAAASIESMHILLVEDNELNAEIARELLEGSGAEVTVANDGAEAIELFCGNKTGSFDAILMDLMMPGMNGFEATRAIRHSGHADAFTVPIIAMTANAFAEDAQAAREAGMDAHLSKPIDIEKLKETLARFRGKGPDRQMH